MKYLTIEQIKQQLRLDDQQVFDEHDLLELYGDSAEDTVLNILNRTMEDVIEQYGRIPAALRHATLMLVDNAYKERSPITPQNMSTVPYAFDLLVKPYMHLV